jgi:hypothetical protein
MDNGLGIQEGDWVCCRYYIWDYAVRAPIVSFWKEVEICGSQMETHHVVMGIKDSVLYISHILVPTTSNEQSSLTRISRLDGQKGVGR